MLDVSARRLPFIPLSSIVLAFSLLAASEASAQQSPLITGLTTKEEPPKAGLRVLEVYGGSPAQDAGLKSMDTIARYGDFPVVDAASYFVARDAYEKFLESKIEIVYWRGRERFAVLIKPGRLGIEFNEYNPVAYQLDSLMTHLNLFIEEREYYLEALIAKGALQPREKVVAEISAAIDKATLDGSLTPAQILVATINSIPDDAPTVEIEKQSELLKKLVATQPQSFTDYLGYGVFYKHKRYRPAVACFERALESDPSDVSTRLNLGNAYYTLGMFAKADAAADFALKADSGLTEYGHSVAFQIKANAALGQRNFATAFDYAEKAFRANPMSDYLMSLWQMAAAQNGDLPKFYEVLEASERVLPKDYVRLRCRTDAVEAYILFKNNQVEQARKIASKSIETDKYDSNARYWKQYPTGEEIVKIWKQLLAQN